MTFTLTQEQYEALIALARRGATTDEQLRSLGVFLQTIERANGVTRSFVLVQWQEMDAPLPAGTTFPEVWPPDMRWPIELISRPVARADVDAVLRVRAINPTGVMCTRDPAGIVGWIPVEDFFDVV